MIESTSAVKLTYRYNTTRNYIDNLHLECCTNYAVARSFTIQIKAIGFCVISTKSLAMKLKYLHICFERCMQDNKYHDTAISDKS